MHAIGILIAIIVGIVMGRDAASRGMNPWVWGISIASFMIIALPLYLMVRKEKINK